MPLFSASLSKCVQLTTPYARTKQPIPETVLQEGGTDNSATAKLLHHASPITVAVMAKMSRPNGNDLSERRTMRTRARFAITTEVQVATAAPSWPYAGTATQQE